VADRGQQGAGEGDGPPGGFAPDGDRTPQGGGRGQARGHCAQCRLSPAKARACRRAGGYADAKQFKRRRKVVKRQRTILGIVLREVQRKIGQAGEATGLALTNL
jgi:hypothetical protein